jgi:RNA polymerase sigma factor (sigma-70 family)
MRKFIEGILRTVDPPSPERAERLWAEYRTGGPKADAAFATLMAWYGGTIYRRIWGFIRSDAADDVFQDVLVRLHRRRHRFTNFEHALRWLRGVAMTQSLNARRGEARRTTRERTRAVGGTATSDTATAEIGDALRSALAKLPDREREAVALVYFEGMTRQNGAAALGVHRDTMAKLLETALGRLKSALSATAAGVVITTAGVETALAVAPSMSIARLSVLAEAASVNARGPAFAWLPTRKLVPLILAGGLLAVAAAATLSWSRFMARTPAPVRLNAERLEHREVPTTDLVSALGVGGTGTTGTSDVAADANGNSYMVGSFTGTTDFDPSRTHTGDADILTARGYTDVFVAKYAADGSLAWARRVGGDLDEESRGIAVDSAGNVVINGTFRGAGDFGSITLSAAGSTRDGFVTKFDASGMVVWAKQWGNATNEEYGRGVAVDAAGNVYALGERRTSPNRGYDILKYTSAGVPSWTRSINTSTYIVYGGDLAADATGNVYAVGTVQKTVDFDPGPKTKNIFGNSNYGFVLRLNTQGNFGWVSPFVGTSSSGSPTGFSFASSVTTDGSGNVIVGGYYSHTVDFNPGAGTTTLPTVGGGFIAKLDTSGGLAWARAIERGVSGAQVYVSSLATDAAGNIYAAGNFYDTVDFDPGAGTQSRTATPTGELMPNGAELRRSDAYLLKLTAAGSFAWVETFGGTGGETACVAVNPSGLIHLAGTYQRTVDFDPDPTDTHLLSGPGNEIGSETYNFFLVRLRSN